MLKNEIIIVGTLTMKAQTSHFHGYTWSTDLSSDGLSGLAVFQNQKESELRY